MSAPSAEATLAEGVADAISFGRPFIANPDLVARHRATGRRSTTPIPATFYSSGPEGYTDYPVHDGTGSRLTGSSPKPIGR